MNVNKALTDIDQTVIDLKELLENVSGKFKNYIFKEHSIDDLVKRFSNDDAFSVKLKRIKKLTEDIADKLECLELFENEFVRFLSIQDMIEYIIGDIERFVLYSSFVNDLTSLFCNLINEKIKLFKCNALKSYDEIYDEFNNELFKKEEFFNLNIYVSDNQNDELIMKVNNILW